MNSMQEQDLSFTENWSSIGLEELNERAAMQTRVDRKYLLDLATAARLFPSIPGPVAVLEMQGQRSFAYDSVYFDTADLLSYRQAAFGRRRRYKVRTRTYLDSAQTFLEVKTEGVRAATVKERIPYRCADRARLTAAGHDYLGQALGELLGQHKTSDFFPVLTTGYRRTTLLLEQTELNPVASRMTIDTGLYWSPLHRLAVGAKSPYRLESSYGAQGLVVVETKSGQSPSIADRYLWRAGIRPSKISKYATGLAALNPQLPANKWQRTIGQYLTLAEVEADVYTASSYASAA